MISGDRVSKVEEASSVLDGSHCGRSFSGHSLEERRVMNVG